MEFVVAGGYQSVSYLVPPGKVQAHLQRRHRDVHSVMPRGVELLQTASGAGSRLFEWGHRITQTALKHPEMFDTPETLIRLDMSEFMEKHSVSRIIGSPPGYVGYDEAGQLTEKVRRKPYSVLLFDEIEKAHPDVMNILLQILDEGKITDAQGRTVSFENTVIIMTSNAGSDKKEGALGFTKSKGDASKEKVMKALSDFLRPEFIGRVDEIAVFNDLSAGDYERIAHLMLEELVEPLRDKGIAFSWGADVPRVLAASSVGGARGARDLSNVIRRSVEDEIASIIVESLGKPIKTVTVEVQDDKIAVVSS